MELNSGDIIGQVLRQRGIKFLFTFLNMITDDILSGNLKPGDKLPTENELAESLGVGRNSVRKAIKMLSSFGVIEVKMGAGTYIAESMHGSILSLKSTRLFIGFFLHQSEKLSKLIPIAITAIINCTLMPSKKGITDRWATKSGKGWLNGWTI